MVNIYTKEISSFFNSLVGYLSIALFLLVSGLLLWVFPDTAIPDAGYAVMDSFFDMAPYLFLFLIPAISMRAIAGERSDGTFDLLRSRPNSLMQVVLGKYLGICSIAILALLPTGIYGISLYQLATPRGNIDIGAILGSYVGLFLLTATYASISLFCSSLTKNTVVAFLLGVFACFFAYYCFDAVANMPLFDPYGDLIKGLGVQAHYRSVGRGVLSLTDIIYFASVSALFLLFSIGHLGRAFRKRSRTFTVYAVALILFFGINNLVAPHLRLRIDLTEDRRFTISDATKNILRTLKGPVHITIFLDGNLPSGFAQLKDAALDMAFDLKSYADGNLSFSVVDPLQGDQSERQAITQALIDRGLYPTNLSVKTDEGLSQKLIFPAAIVSSESQEAIVNLLQQNNGVRPEEAINNSIQNLQYAFSSALSRITTERPHFIGFSEGHGEPSDTELFDAMQSLAGGNQVGRVNLDSVTYESLKQLSILFIVKPKTALKESDKYKIDYYVRQGGRVVWAVDQIDASMDYLRQHGSQPLVGRDLNIDDQLFLYGIRLNYDLIADLHCAQIPVTVGNVAGQPQIELAPWYLFPIITATSNHPIVKNLDGIRTEFTGSIDTISSPSIRKTILLTSSPFSRKITSPASINLQMLGDAAKHENFRAGQIPVAVLLQGKFPYIFQDRPAPEGIDTPIDLSTIAQENKMLVFSDADWLINQVNSKDQSPYPLGWDRYTEEQFANKILLQNVVDYLLNDESLINLRSREVKLRLLDRARIKQQKVYWKLLNVAFPILLLSLVALAQQGIRRRRYGKKAV